MNPAFAQTGAIPPDNKSRGGDNPNNTGAIPSSHLPVTLPQIPPPSPLLCFPYSWVVSFVMHLTVNSSEKYQTQRIPDKPWNQLNEIKTLPFSQPLFSHLTSRALSS